MFSRRVLFLVLACAIAGGASRPAAQTPAVNDYVIGAQDVLTITPYDQADLSGKFTVEADGTFSFPMIGRLRAGGSTLRQVDAHLKKQLQDEGLVHNPPIKV